MVKTTLNQLEKQFYSSLLHDIRFVSERLELLEHRATTSAGRPVSVLRGLAEKNVAVASFLGVCSVLV